MPQTVSRVEQDSWPGFQLASVPEEPCALGRVPWERNSRACGLH